MADHKLLRLSATLLFVGELLSLLAGALHPARENPNNHTAVFAEYANSADWTAVHLGQFCGMVVIIAGLLVLFFALNIHSGTPGWAGRFAAVSAGVALAFTGSFRPWMGSPSSKRLMRGRVHQRRRRPHALRALK